ncbi:MAG: cellulose synthase subunit BcsC-related outer membrane protein [Acetobacter okinawensis]|uniref:cellulose synthase subunit BcsC-related outer membrane protein n=1 Tax=Acetobacter okinawensis TaxID=1076594 RepID=UPI0039E94B2E
MRRLTAIRFGITGVAAFAVPVVVCAESLGTAASSSVDVGNLLLQKAQYWHDHQEMDQAWQALAQAAHLSPDNPRVLQLQGLWAHEGGDSAAADAALQTLTRRFPDAPETQALQAALVHGHAQEIDVSGARDLAKAGETSAAAAAYRKLFPDGPPAAYAVEYYETMAGAVGYRDKGRLGLKQLVEKNPNNLDAQIAYAQVLTWRPATRLDGLQRLQKLAALSGLSASQSSAIDHAWSETLHWLAQTPESVPEYDAWLKVHPQDADVKSIREHAAVAEPESALLNRTQGYQALANDSVADADKYFSQAVTERPTDGDALGGLGLVRMRQGRMQEASDLLEKAGQVDPQTASKWSSALASAKVATTYARVKPLMQAGNYTEAKAAIDQALSIDPKQAGLLALSGDVAAKQNNQHGAEAFYRQALAIEPDNADALQGLYALLRSSGNTAELADVERRLARVSPNFGKQVAAADLIRQANAATGLDEKINLLRAAVRAQPHDPWLRLHLAQALVDGGNRGEAADVMEPLLSVQKGAPVVNIQAGIYYGNQIQDTDLIERLLQILPRQGMTPDIRQIADRIRFQKLVAGAPDDPQEARIYFNRIAQQGGEDTTGARGQLMGEALLKRGDAAGAVGLLNEMLRLARVPSARQSIAYAGVMLAAQKPAAVRHVLASLEGMQLTDEEKTFLQGLKNGLAIQRSDQLNDDGKRAEAYDVLAPALQTDQSSAQLALSRLYQSDHNAKKALSITRAVLNQNPDDLDARLQAIRLNVELHDLEQARQDLDSMRERAPSDPRTWVGTSVVAKARGNWTEALNALAQARMLRLESVGTPVEVEDGENPFRHGVSQAGATKTTDPMLASIDREIEVTGKAYAPYLDVGPVFNTRNGTGLGKLVDVEVPIAGSVQWGQGRLNASVTPVSLSAGDGPAQYSGHDAAGVALNAGYEWNWLKGDVGSTPLGFASSNVVAGLQFFPQITDNLHLSFVVERRALTDSVVSYSGMKNKDTGKTWGGVMKNHIHLQLAYSGNGYTVYGGGGYAYLDGKNTRTNEEYEAGIGGAVTVYKNHNQEVQIGSNLTWFRFDNNQYVFPDQNYPDNSYGYGGYFSPQSFFSVTVPITYTGKVDKWLWDVGGQLGYQNYHSQALTNIDDADQPIGEARPSNHLIGGAHANFSYQVSPALRVGANFQFQNAGPWNQFIAGLAAHYTFLDTQ